MTAVRDALELVAHCGGGICADGLEGQCPGHPRETPTMDAVIALESLEELHTAFQWLATRYMDAALTRDAQARALEARVQRLEDGLTRIVTGAQSRDWRWCAEEAERTLSEEG